MLLHDLPADGQAQAHALRDMGLRVYDLARKVSGQGLRLKICGLGVYGLRSSSNPPPLLQKKRKSILDATAKRNVQ